MEKINPKFKFVNVIGCGFAGIEAALFLARHGIKVHVFNIANDKLWAHSNLEFENLEKETSIEENRFNELLEYELAYLESPLALKFKEEKEKGHLLTEQQLWQFGFDLVKHNENIKYFEAAIGDINPRELTIISTGNKTDKGLFDFLLKRFGSMKIHDTIVSFPVLNGIDEDCLFKSQSKDKEYYLPLSREEYLAFLNAVIDEINEVRLKDNQNFNNKTIEFFVEKGFDDLKNYAMPPIFVEGMVNKPYAAIKLKKVKQGFELQNLTTFLGKLQQMRIFRFIKPFQNAIIETEASISDGCLINSQYLVNKFFQANQNENLFFAGGILGLCGWRQCAASGMMIGMNILKIVYSQKLVLFPSNTAIGKIKEAVCDSEKEKYPQFARLLKSTMINYENKSIIELIKMSTIKLEKFKEEYINGKHV